MTDEAAPQGRPDRQLPHRPAEHSGSPGQDGARRAPALIVRIELEQLAQIALDAETFQDELRLRSWLRRSLAMRLLPRVLARLLDDLDAKDSGEVGPGPIVMRGSE